VLKKAEYDGYRAIVEGKETAATLASMNPDEISKLLSEFANTPLNKRGCGRNWLIKLRERLAIIGKEVKR